MDREALIALGIGMMFLAAGAAAMSVMFDWLPDSQSITIEPGEKYSETWIKGRWGGNVHVSFNTEGGYEVRFMILNSEQYEAYVSGKTHESVYEVTASTGDFESHLSEQRYHLVFERAQAGQTNELLIWYVASVTGVITMNLVLSGAFVATGLILLALGLRPRSERLH